MDNLPLKDGTWSDLSPLAEPMPESGMTDGSMIEFSPDGSVEVTLDATAIDVPLPDPGHKGNLADVLPENELVELAEKIVQWRDDDKLSRKDWESRINEALKLLGVEELSDSDVNGIKGASKVGHPLLAEIAVQFQARAMEECFPSTGPAKTMVIGKVTQEREEQADRVEGYLNYHLTERDEDYYDDTDQMLFLLPLYGSMFRKSYVDPIEGIPVARFCDSTSVYVPYSAKSLKAAPRITHQFSKSVNDIRRAIATGFYRDVELIEGASFTKDETRDLQDKSDERTNTVVIEDGNHTLLECHCDLELSIDKGKASYDLPYIVTVDEDSGKVLAIRRNWREGDPKFRKRNWWTHYKYLPGFGLYGMGLLHLVGVMAKVAGGAIRALLDAAARANFQGGFKSKEARVAGDQALEMGKWKDVDMSSEELHKAFYTPDFREPSGTLFKLLEYIVDNARRFGSVTEAMVGDSAPTGPVGTMLAIIEQGSKVFSGIHKRIHTSLRKELKILVELIGEHLPAYYPYEVEGAPREVLARDFSAEIDVLPVSDPNIFSSTQRIALAQATMELVSSMPDVFKGQRAKKEVAKRMLTALKVPNPEALMPKRAPRLDPVTENQLILTARPIEAFAEQDHMAHIQCHMNFTQGMPEEQMKAVMPLVMAHVAEHQAHLYRQQALGNLPIPIQDLDNPQELPLQIETLVARAVAQNRIQAPNVMGGQQGPGGIPPEAIEQMKAEAEQLQKQREEVIKMLQEAETMKKQVDDAKRALDAQQMKMNSAHEAFLTTADLRKQELAVAQRSAETTLIGKQAQIAAKMQADKDKLAQEQIALERLAATIEAKMERIKDMTERLQKEAEENPDGDDKAGRDKLMADLLELGQQVVKTMGQPRQRVVTERDAAGRIKTVAEKVGG